MQKREWRIRPSVTIAGNCPTCGMRVTFETWLPYGKEGAVTMKLPCKCGTWFLVETTGLPFETDVESEEIGW